MEIYSCVECDYFVYMHSAIKCVFISEVFDKNIVCISHFSLCGPEFSSFCTITSHEET